MGELGVLHCFRVAMFVFILYCLVSVCADDRLLFILIKFFRHSSALLFPKFRCGWSMSLQAIPQKLSKKPSLTTFMLIAKKESSTMLQQISSSLNSSIDCHGDQVKKLGFF